MIYPNSNKYFIIYFFKYIYYNFNKILKYSIIVVITTNNNNLWFISYLFSNRENRFVFLFA